MMVFTVLVSAMVMLMVILPSLPPGGGAPARGAAGPGPPVGSDSSGGSHQRVPAHTQPA